MMVGISLAGITFTVRTSLIWKHFLKPDPKRPRQQKRKKNEDQKWRIQNRYN